jgi:transcriptional regulator EpsA
MVILSKLEQEYLLRCIESGVGLADLRQFYLWSQGPLQALLPHAALLCMEVDGGGRLRRFECLRQAVLAPDALALLEGGLGPALARAWRAGPPQPALLELETAEQPGVLASCRAALGRSGFGNALVHGSAAHGNPPYECAAHERGATVFAFLGLPMRPGARQAWFLQLLLPYLHLALLRLAAGEGASARLARALSARELAVLEQVRAGRSNEEAAHALGISALTVKNHLQRVYRVLGVGNRAHAVARCMELRLL